MKSFVRISTANLPFDFLIKIEYYLYFVFSKVIRAARKGRIYEPQIPIVIDNLCLAHRKLAEMVAKQHTLVCKNFKAGG